MPASRPHARSSDPDERRAATEPARRRSRYLYAERRVRQIVDAMPPFTPDELDALAGIFANAKSGSAGAA